MKRLVIIGIFAVAMLLTLAGCQKKNNSKKAEGVSNIATANIPIITNLFIFNLPLLNFHPNRL